MQAPSPRTMLTICIDERDPNLLTVSFPTDIVGNDLIRNVPNRRWSYSRRCWVVPNTRTSLICIGKLFGKAYCRFDEAVVRLYKPTADPQTMEQATTPPWPPAGVPPAGQFPATNASSRRLFRYAPPTTAFDQHPAIVALCNTLRTLNYSYKTLKNYRQALIALIQHTAPHPIDTLSKETYQQYLLYLVTRRRLSSSTRNIHINAYKFYREKVLGHNAEFYPIDYARTPTKLPTVYSIADVKALFGATTSLKYRTLFKLVYGTGLRLSEVAHLRLTDLDRNRHLINVRGGKGKKDRVVMLTNKLLALLDDYLRQYTPTVYLFENVDNREPLQNRTIQLVYSQAVQAANIQKRGGIHTLRHSFATHLLESGIDIRYIQQLLGHESILTTMRYTHVTADKISQIKSPLDDL